MDYKKNNTNSDREKGNKRNRNREGGNTKKHRTKKVVEPVTIEEKKTGTKGQALGAGRQATAAAPPSCKVPRR
jgi:hypothetical protein